MNKDLLPMAASILKNLPRTAQFIRDVTTVSPTQAAAQNTVVSRAYVEDSCARLDITPNILKALQSMYAGMILIILQRSNEVAAGRTVSDTLNKVYTRGMGVEHFYTDMVESLDQEVASIEALRHDHVFATEDANTGETAAKAPSFDVQNRGGEIAPPDLLPVGQVLKISLVGRLEDGTATKSDVLIAVRMTPYIVADQAMELILTEGYKPSFRMRWMQWKAGEISFWSDLLFQADRIRKIEEATRKDRSGGYQSFLKDTTRRDKDRALDIIYNLPTPQAMSNNLANSVIITSTDAIRRAAADTGFDLNDAAQRQRFFNGSYVMMMAVIDPHYHHVTLYLNGYELPQHYSFNDFSAKKKMDAADFMQMFSAMGAAGGSRPTRF